MVGAVQQRPAGGRLADPMLWAVLALGITQIIGWGTTHYALGVLGTPILAEMGWSRSTVFLGFTVALITGGFASTWIGRLIDMHGGRRIMTIGSALMAVGLVALAHVKDQAIYLAVWAFLGIAMRMTLYDAAFAALVQVTPTRGRRAISYLTLFGGLASSIFWPIGHYLAAAVGWREAVLIYAALNAFICLPLHLAGLARREAAAAPAAAVGQSANATERQPLEGRARRIGIALFALIMSLNGFVFGVLSVLLVSVLESTGLAVATAVWLASLKGVAQVGGRIVEMFWWRNLHPLTVGRISIALLPASILLLLWAGASFPLALAFTLVMGASQGILTIVRGAVPLALFGPAGYGTVLGLIATPIMLVNALAPTIYAAIIDTWGAEVGEWLLFGCAVLAMLAMEATALWYWRRRS
ncbi:MAG: MFS transporter [Hyphomicrobiaceae bacterium]